MHQPYGLMSPSTTLQECGGTNSVHVAHMRTSFGLSWYFASCLDIFSAARAEKSIPVATPIRTVMKIRRRIAHLHVENTARGQEKTYHNSDSPLGWEVGFGSNCEKLSVSKSSPLCPSERT